MINAYWIHCCIILLWVGSFTTAAPAGESNRRLLDNIFQSTRGGSIAGPTIDDENPTSSSATIRVAYQGEPGAYSEKATRELLGPNVFAVGRPSFESAFRAVASMEADYACLPIENSLGGSIHENYDLMLRYQL